MPSRRDRPARPARLRAAVAPAVAAAAALALSLALAAGAAAAPRASGADEPTGAAAVTAAAADATTAKEVADIPAPRTPERLAYDAALVLAAGETVYVHPSQDRIFSRIQADQIRGKIIRVGGHPYYVAVLPGNAASDDGDRQLKELTKRLGFNVPATIAVVTGGRLRGASTTIPFADARRFAEEAIAEHETDPLEVKVSDFIERVAQEAGKSESGGTGGVITGVVMAIVVFGGGGILLLRRRRRWHELERVRPLAVEDMEALERAARALPEPEAGYVRSPVSSAAERIKRARGCEHMPPVARDIARARRALVVAQSELAGQVAPAETPSCFFDGRHGPSVAALEWTPGLAGAAPRSVPACAACAQRLSEGAAPAARQVSLGEEQLGPWYAGGPELARYLAPDQRELLAGLPAGAPLRPRRWLP